MWNLTLEQYVADYLSPALEHFNRAAEPPDCFARYGLPITIEDGGDISEALRVVPGFWSQLKLQNPKYQPLVAALQKPQEFEAVRQVLSDPRKRADERRLIAAKRERRRD